MFERIERLQTAISCENSASSQGHLLGWWSHCTPQPGGMRWRRGSCLCAGLLVSSSLQFTHCLSLQRKCLPACGHNPWCVLCAEALSSLSPKAPCSQDLVRFLYPLQKKYLATFYFLIIFKLFSPHNDTLRKALLLFPNHRWGNWGQVSWDELTEVLQVVSDRVWLSLQSVTAGSCSPFSPVLTEFYFCVLKFFLFFGWATRLVGS